MSKLYLEFVHSDTSKDGNPYHVRDGKWGGFGSPSWFVFPDIDQRNVFQKDVRSTGRFEYIWARVWDDEKQLWRDITSEEHLKLPSLKIESKKTRARTKYLNSSTGRENLGKFMMPVIGQVFPELITADIVGVQPMQTND